MICTTWRILSSWGTQHWYSAAVNPELPLAMWTVTFLCCMPDCASFLALTQRVRCCEKILSFAATCNAHERVLVLAEGGQEGSRETLLHLQQRTACREPGAIGRE
jgi:hypothetical protein